MTFDEEKIVAAARFWAKVKKSDGCWEWQGAVGHGYGKFGFQGKVQGAHRVALMLSGISVPSDAVVCHRCDNKPCVRPDHLFLGTPKDNVADWIAKGRKPSPPVLHRALRPHRACEEEEMDIRASYRDGASIGELVCKHGLSRPTIDRILKKSPELFAAPPIENRLISVVTAELEEARARVKRLRRELKTLNWRLANGKAPFTELAQVFAEAKSLPS